MEKEEIVKKIKEALGNPTKGRNSMGCSENYYNAFYMVGKCFTEEEINNLDKVSLLYLIQLAEFASDVFY